MKYSKRMFTCQILSKNLFTKNQKTFYLSQIISWTKYFIITKITLDML